MSEIESTLIQGKKKWKEEEGSVVYATDDSLLKEVTDIKEIHKDVVSGLFSESDVMLKDDRIFIRWKTIPITNSMDESHIMHDVIIRIKITPTSNTSPGTRKVDVRLGLMRTTFTCLEMEKSYSFSHLETGQYGRFGDLCLGGSDFSLLVQQVMVNPIISNWTLFFMSIENYLSWESIEGGPYQSIHTLFATDGNVNYSNEQIDIESTTLCQLLSVDDLEYPEIKIKDSCINDIIVKHCSFQRRDVQNTSYTEKQLKDYQLRLAGYASHIMWNEDERVDFKVIMPPPSEKKDVTIPQEVIRRIKSRMNGYLQKYKKHYQHEQYKKSANRNSFSLGETKGDRDRRSSKENRVAP